MTTIDARVRDVLAWLERTGTPAFRAGLARYAIPTDNAYGVPVGVLQRHAKSLGRDQDLAEALWATGRYEAQMLAAFTGEVDRLTPAGMDRWVKTFDNWGICDTVCLHLFDRSPHAWKKVAPWCARRGEFEKRAGFALLAALALHDKQSGDAPFRKALALIEKGAVDDRNFVKKAVNWALRAVGQRNAALHAASIAVAKRLAASPDPAPRWVGKDALRDLSRPLIARRLAKRAAAAKG
ncbi:MAG TPA: DNA alkylation repair protein [Planctomycetota bacterium]|nr:DNA alkylation repair protein [Planctomycetota bacterium]